MIGMFSYAVKKSDAPSWGGRSGEGETKLQPENRERKTGD
jgi:hypothetical protein